MSKAELVAKMQNLQILDASGSRHELWVEAFRQFNAQKSLKLKMGCGSCYKQVRDWLRNG